MLKIFKLFFIICVGSALVIPEASAQNDSGYKTAANSGRFTGIQLPAGAVRLREADVPAEIRETLAKLVALGNGKFRQGDTEILVWTGGNYGKSSATQFVSRFAASLQNAGWTYAAQEQNKDFTVFNLTGANLQRSVVGFFVTMDDSILLAWAEMLPAILAGDDSPKTKNRPSVNNPSRTNMDDSAKVITVEKNALWVNLMGDQMPSAPAFTQLAAKPNRVRGYVKDWTGKPLANATIGVRGSFFAGQYSGGQGTTDQNGYYEFVVPKGTAHFYNAGCKIQWGEGVAAVSLHPADGALDSFTTADGAVENFVLLPYGVTNRENLQKQPRLSSTYYGGSIYVHYSAAEADDNRPMAGSILENSILEIILTPEDTAGKGFVIRQPVGFAGNLTINNIPLGRYKIAAKANGKTLKLKENRKYNSVFGLSPSEATGAASILFVPNQANDSMIAPQNGAWESVSLDVSMP